MVKSAQTLACHRSMLTGLSHCTHENTACCSVHVIFCYIFCYIFTHLLSHSMLWFPVKQLTHACTLCYALLCVPHVNIVHVVIVVVCYCSQCKFLRMIQLSRRLLGCYRPQAHPALSKDRQGPAAVFLSLTTRTHTHITSLTALFQTRGGSDLIATGVIQQMGARGYASKSAQPHCRQVCKGYRITASNYKPYLNGGWIATILHTSTSAMTLKIIGWHIFGKPHDCTH